MQEKGLFDCLAILLETVHQGRPLSPLQIDAFKRIKVSHHSAVLSSTKWCKRFRVKAVD